MMVRHVLLGAAAVLVTFSAAATAATTSVDYAAIVRANERAISSYNACTTNACRTSVIRSVQYRINTRTTGDMALTPVVQRATARQLLEIFNTALSCPAGQAATCAKQNSKTFGSLTYRITSQPPVSPI